MHSSKKTTTTINIQINKLYMVCDVNIFKSLVIPLHVNEVFEDCQNYTIVSIKLKISTFVFLQALLEGDSFKPKTVVPTKIDKREQKKVPYIELKDNGYGFIDEIL